MWTTKRLLLLAAGFGLFFALFLVYSVYLGGIDGLPPLMEGYGPGEDRTAKPILITPPLTDQKLKLAFGDRDDIQKMPIKLEVNSKNLVLASETFDVLKDGRVRLMPFYLAVFGKNQVQGKFPEINTIKGDVAFLTFDQPVSNIAELGKRKITAGELSGNIYIKNNRKTATQDDDLSLTTPGPMYYREDQHLIWTMAPVRVLDTQSKPEPTTITADGMDLVLTADKPETAGKPAAPAAAKKGKQTVNGVETVTLRANVEMHLIDTNSGFLGGPAKPKPGEKTSVAKANEPTDKPKVVITTPGPFRYDVAADHARFDVPPKRGPLPEKVTVTRLSGPPGKEKHDYLYCEHLELQFARKNEPATPASAHAANESETHSMDLNIQDAHATGREVEIISEAEGLHAIGNDFFYDANTKVSILKGTPEMVALKDGNEIHTAVLHMVNVGDKDAQQVKAMGKGYVSILDKASSWKRSQYAYWDDSANFSKEGDFDCLTLVGKGRFEDREHHQTLGADKLKVWLMPEKESNQPAKEEKTNSQKMRPHHLEGEGHVMAHSDELIITEPTEHLYVWFRDAPPKEPTALVAPPAGPGFAETPQAGMPMGDPAPIAAGQASMPTGDPEPRVAGKPAAGEPRPLERDVKQPTLAPPPATGSAPPPAKKRPLILSSRSVEAFVTRTSEKNEIEKIRCDGHVVVLQEPEKSDPNDKGVDIRGDKLTLDNNAEGGVLLVTGNMAVVQLNKITISGDEVNINQRTNQAWVPGRGWMKMLSTASLADGGKPAPPSAAEPKKPEKASELTIHWKQDMQFDGRHAVFTGDIQAEQEASRLLCKKQMQVMLDNPVSLKEGQKGSPPAKVKEIVCDETVRMEENVAEKDGKIVRKSRLLAPVVTVNNEDGEMNAAGPGVVYLLQYGSSDAGPSGKPADASKPPAPPELKLTRINYMERLYSNNSKRTATFYGGVEVINLPTDNIDQVVDVDKPPKGCLYLRCDLLKVYSHKLADGRTSQEMDAMRHVVVQSQEFWGVADRVTYDESKDLVIMEGGEGGKATLYRERFVGASGDKLRGKKIWYWRKKNEFKVEGGDGIDVR